MSVIPRAPAAPPAQSPHDPRYYEPRDLEAELRRTFQICHECRMCVNYCGSFPELFKRIDRDVDAGAAVGAEKLDAADVKAVGDQCWQCKLCYIKCPYTPDEGAPELLDFPRLMSRERAARAQRDGIPLVDRILGEPQAIGQLGSGIAAPVANLVTRSQLLRKVQEKVTGISAEFPLPPMAEQPFSRWLAKHEPAPSAGELGEVVLFATCYGEFNTPSVVRAATLVLEHNGYGVRYPGVGGAAGQRAGALDMLTCCGLPNIDGGDVAAATEKIKHNVALLLPLVRAGLKIVVPGPSCGMMMKREWREYVPTPEAAEVAAATLDLMEFLVVLGKEKKLKRQWKLRARRRGLPLGLPPARAEDRLPGDARAQHHPRHRGADDRGVLRRRRDVGDEGRPLRGRAPLRREAGARHRRGRARRGRDRLLALGAPDRQGEQALPPAPRRGRGVGLRPRRRAGGSGRAERGGDDMKPIDRSEILPLGDYESVRPHFRARVIEEKKARRTAIGEHLTAVFENRDTVLLQIQEMLRTERITAEAPIAHEIATYNELLPGERQVSLTLFVEIADKPTRDRALLELAGLEDAISVEVDGARFPAWGPRPAGFVEGITTAVHYLKATLSPEAAAAASAGAAQVSLVVSHPRLQARAPLGRAALAALAEDLKTP